MGGPQALGAAPLSAALCLAEDAAGRYISPFHDIPLYADAGKVRGPPGFGGRGWSWGRQRGCRAEGTLQKAVGAAPTFLLAARRRGVLPSKDSDTLVFISKYRAPKVLRAGTFGWCCALQVLLEQSNVVTGVRCCPQAGRLHRDVSHLAGLLAAPAHLTVSEHLDLSLQTVS